MARAGGPDDDPVHYQKRDTGGWSQARYQRHIDNHRKDFAAEIVQAIGDLVEREDAQHVVLAGDQVVMSHLNRAMPKALAEKVTGVFQADIRVNVNDIVAEVAPIMEQAERDAGMSAVERLVGEVRRGGLGVAGVEATGKALEAKLPRRYWVAINRVLVPFGKHICTGRLPHCSTCPVLEYCRQVGVRAHR